ncbi:MAG: hypothetical protein F4X64_02925, partial [Chloroflexi bacterium]|nr:hypothetical protein [Chloroflexota bacterium]
MRAALCRALDELASSSAGIVRTNGKPIPATYGRNSGASLRIANPQSSMVSRLQALLAGRGFPWFELRWKYWDMLLGPPICALRASALRTPVSGIGLWRSPTATRGGNPGSERFSEKRAKRQTIRLADQVSAVFGVYQTPKASDGDWGMPRTSGRPIEKSTHLQTQVRAIFGTYATPTAEDGRRGNAPPRPHDTGIPLSQQVMTFQTPRARG